MDDERRRQIEKAVEEEFSVRTMLNISLVRAKGLKITQKGKLGCCCCCRLSGRPYTMLKTEGVSSSSPAWNYTGMIDGCISGDNLELTVFSDSKGTECLGQAVLDYSVFHPHGFTGVIPLADSSAKKPPELEIKVEVLPVPTTTPKDLRVFVSFVAADDLPGEDDANVSPYCVCEISGKSDSKVLSRICQQTRNPEWNELHEVDDYDDGDGLIFSVLNSSAPGGDELLGSAVLPNSAFGKTGFDGALPLRVNDEVQGTINVSVDVGGPSSNPARQLSRRTSIADRKEGIRLSRRAGSYMSLEDGVGPTLSTKSQPRRPSEMDASAAAAAHPSDLIGPDNRSPVPFQLRSLDTNRVHRLCAYTVIGRSRSLLDVKHDLVLDSPGICDVSRVHAVIKVWPGADAQSWCARIFDDKNDRGYFYDDDDCRVLIGGGTFVDGEPVDVPTGVDISTGTVLRFGVNELWVMESAPMHQRLRAAEMACRTAQDAEDPDAIRELCIPSNSCDSALKRCGDWISIVKVVLEALHEPDEAPCADFIEVKDECGRPVSRHLASTLEQQEAYDVKSILQDVRLGATVKLRLSSDPCLLAPVLGHVERERNSMEEVYRSRAQFLG